MDNIYYIYGANKMLEFGYLLSYYKMATDAPIVSSGTGTSTTNRPRLIWHAQGGSSHYPNDEFLINVFDDNGDEILIIGGLTTTFYTLSEYEWETILELCYSNVTFSIISLQTDTPETGWYYSEPLTYSVLNIS